MDLLTVLVGVAVTILMAAIPWAFAMNSKLVRIDTELKGALDMRDRVIGLETRVLSIEIRGEAPR